MEHISRFSCLSSSPESGKRGSSKAKDLGNMVAEGIFAHLFVHYEWSPSVTAPV